MRINSDSRFDNSSHAKRGIKTGRELLDYLTQCFTEEGALDKPVLFVTGAFDEGLVVVCAYVDDKGQAWVDLDEPLGKQC